MIRALYLAVCALDGLATVVYVTFAIAHPDNRDARHVAYITAALFFASAVLLAGGGR